MTMQIVRHCSLSIHHFVETVHNESVGKKEQATTSKARLFQHQRLEPKFDESMSFGSSVGYNLGSSVVFHGFVHYGMITSGVGNLTLDLRHSLSVQGVRAVHCQVKGVTPGNGAVPKPGSFKKWLQIPCC